MRERDAGTRSSANVNKQRLVTTLLTALFIFGGTALVRSKYESFEEFSATLSELGGVRIGDERAQVAYKNGTPYEIAANGDDLKTYVKTDSANTQLDNFPVWTYWSNDGLYRKVEFNDINKVERISCLIETTTSNDDCYTVGHVHIQFNSDESFVLGALGQPDQIRFDTRGHDRRKTLVYDEMGLTFIMTHEKVMAIIKEPSRPGFWWWLRNGPK